MNTNEIAVAGATQLAQCLSRVREDQIDGLANAIVAARGVYVCGAGRSLLMMRCMAMRLMHLGFTSYVVGDTTTPAFGEGDLLVAASGSGSTSSVTNVAAKAKLLGGTLAVITTRADSALGRMADHLVEVPVLTDQVDGECVGRPLLPGGSLFEQATLLIGDAMVLPLGARHRIPTDQAFALHANLE